MCSIPFHPIPFVPIPQDPCSIRFPSPLFPVFPVGCGVDVLYILVVVGPKGKARWLVGLERRPCLVPEAKRKGVRSRGDRPFLFFFFGSLEACMGRSGCSAGLSHSSLVFFAPYLFFVTLPSLSTFSSFALVPISFPLSTFSSFALVPISFPLSMSIFSPR